MKTTYKLESLFTILIAFFCQNLAVAQQDSIVSNMAAPIPWSAVLDAQTEFRERYSTEKEIDSNNIVIPVGSIREAWFSAQSTKTANGLVFHYLIDEDQKTLKYLVGIGLLEDSEIKSYGPFPPSGIDTPNAHYYMIEASQYISSPEIIAVTPQDGLNYIYPNNLDSLHHDYDSLMNRRGWFNLNRDVANIRRHPNMIHYPFDSLKEFHHEYNYHIDEYYLSNEQIIREGESPELYLYISTGAYNGGNKWKRRFHSPILRFGSALAAFEIDDDEYSGRRYKNKAFDVGVLCPPNCPSEIWPGR
jgi:hypothetical protein